MGKNKKPFIDKKNASTYHVVRRSMRDVGGHLDEETGEMNDVPSDFVLMPAPKNSAATNQLILGGRGAAGGAGRSSGGGGAASAANASQDKEAASPRPPHQTGTMSKLQRKIASAGLLDDDYDYDQHMKPITGTGIFFSGETGHVADATGDIRSKDVDPNVLDSDIKEVSRQLDSIALTPDCMDDDIAQALFGEYDEGDFEEILDDFCLTANEEPGPDADGESDKDKGAFDYDEHIQALIAKAEKAERGGDFDPDAVPEDHTAWRDTAKEFGNVRPLHMRGIDEEEDEDDDSLDREFGGDYPDGGDPFAPDGDDDGVDDYGAPGVVSSLPPDQERALREKFEQTLAEYDSDDVGDLDDECEDIRGDREFEGDAQLEAAFDDFLQEKKDEIFIEGTRHLPENKRVGGSGYAALVNGKMVRGEALADAVDDADGNAEETKEEAAAQMQEELAEAEQILANPEMEPAPFEDVLIDGKSYFSERHQNPFDCESILTTYSNLDNNPAVISRSGRRNRKGKKGPRVSRATDVVPEEEPVTQFVLSNKTGLPLGVLGQEGGDDADDGWDGDDTLMSVNKGEARNKNESKAEKKARKNAIKEERRIARLQKKMMKEAFAEEFDRRADAVGDNELAGKSVFRIS